MPEYDELFLERRRLYLKDPWQIHPILLPPCRVRILLVTDGGGSFGLDNFGLKALIDTLELTPPGPWVRFEVTTAHRDQGTVFSGTAELQGFDFSVTDLAPFDQIWLVGTATSGAPKLSAGELEALSRFMDGGGGVFATGDHEDLGVALCGDVPRVRSMRKWHWPNPGPNNEPVAPNVGGLDRLDTLTEGNDPDVQFDDQSDDVPQTILPRMYFLGGPFKYFHRSYPHPLLCGPRGVIRVLPDHPHEGECYVPADLTKTFTFGGYTTEEYPALPGGQRLAPEVIATSTSGTGGRTAADTKGEINYRTFGAIGAWDGHRVSRGRVVVDATWHHFFNINLIGQLLHPDPIKSGGFPTTPTGRAAYEEIKSYFRNIAVWLARPPRQTRMWWRALWMLRWDHRFLMDLRPEFIGGRIERLDLHEMLRIGTAARDSLGRWASQCQSLIWVWPFIERWRPELWEQLRPWADPWWPFPPEPDPWPDPLPWLWSDVVLNASLGAGVYALAGAFPEARDELRQKAEDGEPEKVFANAVGLAVDRAVEALASTRSRLDEIERRFGAARGKGPANER